MPTAGPHRVGIRPVQNLCLFSSAICRAQGLPAGQGGIALSCADSKGRLIGQRMPDASTVFHGSPKMWTAAVNLSVSIAPAPFEPDSGETRSTSMSTTGNRASMSLAQATAATGMVKSSILRAIKCGRISAVRDDLGRWLIEPVELHRVFVEQRCEGDAAAHGAAGENVADDRAADAGRAGRATALRSQGRAL